MLTLGLVVSLFVNVVFIVVFIIAMVEGGPISPTIEDDHYTAMKELAKWHAVCNAQHRGLQRQARHIQRLKNKLSEYL